MKLLFVDTETSGVDYQKDQIIELGAMVVEVNGFELKMLDYFQTTVSLRKPLDERITRITGITEAELATAPNIVKAQTNYNTWVEKYDNQIAGIVGHSVDFDIGFLKKEGWYLPSNNNYDTLNLAKIILPNMQAINLEFLSKKIGFGSNLKGIPDEGLSYHRALYDTIMCVNLFEHCLNQINGLECTQQFADQISELFLPSEICFYKSENINPISINRSNQSPSLLEFTGNISNTSINDKIQNLSYNQNLVSALSWKLPKEYKIVILQLYTISIWNTRSGQSNIFLKLHSLGIGFWIANLAIDSFENQAQATDLTLIHPENIIDQINKIADISINFETIVNYLEILDKILKCNDAGDQNIVNWLSQYEFLLVSLQSAMIGYELKINFLYPNVNEKTLVQKFINLIENLKTLKLPNLQNLDSYIIIANLETKIREFIDKIKFVPNGTFTFKLISNKSLFVSKYNEVFDLNNHFENLSTHISQIQTNLNEPDYNQLLALAGVHNNFTQTIKYETNYNYQKIDAIPMLDFVNSNIETAKNTQKPILILCGQNSSIKNLSKVVIENDLMDNVLIVGESGGITKIASKIDQGFVGIVLVKFSALEYFYNLRKSPKFERIVLYDRPYFFINEFWYNQSKKSNTHSPDNFLKTLKDIYLQGKVNGIHKRFESDVALAYNLF